MSENCCLVYHTNGSHDLWGHTPSKRLFPEGSRFFEFDDNIEVIEVVKLIEKLNRNDQGWNRFDPSLFKEV